MSDERGGSRPHGRCRRDSALGRNALTVTDIATGWTENRSVRNKAEKWVSEALMDIRGAFPFPIIGVDVDYADLWVMPTSPRIALPGKDSGVGQVGITQGLG